MPVQNLKYCEYFDVNEKALMNQQSIAELHGTILILMKHLLSF